MLLATWWWRDDHPLVGHPAPAFELIDAMTTEPVRLQDYRGKMVLIEFWSTWCPHCVEMLASLDQLQRDPLLADKVVILTINVREKKRRRKRRVARFLKKRNYRFAALLGDRSIMKRYGGVARIPALFVVGASGKIRRVKIGSLSEDEVRKIVSSAM